MSTTTAPRARRVLPPLMGLSETAAERLRALPEVLVRPTSA